MTFLCTREGNKSSHGQILILIIVLGHPKNFEMFQKFKNYLLDF